MGLSEPTKKLCFLALVTFGNVFYLFLRFRVFQIRGLGLESSGFALELKV